jgi:hypothetical protein
MKMKRNAIIFFFIFPWNGSPVEWNWQRETEVLGGKTCPSVTLSTTNPTWTDPGSNLVLHCGRSATNRLSHGTAFTGLTRFVFLSFLLPSKFVKGRDKIAWYPKRNLSFAFSPASQLDVSCQHVSGLMTGVQNLLTYQCARLYAFNYNCELAQVHE